MRAEPAGYHFLRFVDFLDFFSLSGDCFLRDLDLPAGAAFRAGTGCRRGLADFRSAASDRRLCFGVTRLWLGPADFVGCAARRDPSASDRGLTLLRGCVGCAALALRGVATTQYVPFQLCPQPDP